MSVGSWDAKFPGKGAWKGEVVEEGGWGGGGKALEESSNCSPVLVGTATFGPMVPMLFYRF